ncbi:MAG: response regulator [Vicinamibacterales bacterium]|jgi:two-component system cell cycle sensor histidine kinase/response regulator CckA|nr:response regulator [Vicinamibacterales bacterium]
MSSTADEARAAAERRLATVGQLAGAIAHDFNNQLTAILGYAGLLLDELPADDPHREDIEEIQRSGERAARLTRQLLAFRRNADVPPQLLSWPALLDELQPLLAAAAGQRVAFEVAVGGDPVPEVTLQKADASHVMFALALLARDGMPGGGRCRLEVRSEAGDLLVSATLEPGTGGAHDGLPGGALADLEHLARVSGGRLARSGDWPARARFDIRYHGPRVAAEAVRVAPLAPSGVVVLLAEDEPALRQVIRRMLERDHLAVVDAETGEAALELLHAPGTAFDVLVTDLVMPGASGVDLARRIVVEHPGLVVLFVSGYVDVATLDLGTFTTPVGFLAKPFTREQMLSAIGDLLAERQRRARA